MKYLSLILMCVVMINTKVFAQTTLTKTERKKAITHLKSAQKDLLKTVKGLSEAQLNFKPNATTWSIAECMEHIAITEKSIFELVDIALKEKVDPSKRAEVNMTDEQVVEFISDRNKKSKTPTSGEPKNNFTNYEGSVATFKARRKSTIQFVKSTSENLRHHYFKFRFGTLDAYQIILFLSGHSVRHTKQIKEIMSNASFPKS